MTGKVYVILDASSWISERLLRSSMGAALIHLLLRQQWRIGLPETVQDEITRRLIDQGVNAIADVQQGTRLLGQLVGQPIMASPVDEASIRRGIEQRWQGLATIIETLPLSMEIVRAALDRVIRAIPPSKQSEQFRDCCIWEEVAQIATQCEVHLVTSDKDFYEKRDFSQGLATELRDHAAKLSRPVLLHRTVADCVKSLEEAAPIGIEDESELAQKIAAYVEPGLRQKAVELNFELGRVATVSVKTFPTDQPTAIAISFELTYDLTEPKVPPQRTSASVTAYGNCTLDPTTQMISDLRPDRETFRWVDGKGASQESTNQYAYGYFGGTPMLGSPHALLFSSPV